MIFFSFSFLAKRGVKDEIQTFDARRITPEIRKSVEDLLKKTKGSFEPQVRGLSGYKFEHHTQSLVPADL